ncbi:hypothetical protein Tco_0690061 [Tanacetum coccineum]
MVACLEKTEGNSRFHEIVDFLTSSSIHHALTQIHAIIDSKAVVVTEASIRSSLLFNDADGTACLTNEAIFQNLALMGYEGELNKLTFQKALFSPQWKYLIHTILHCLSSKSTSWNEFSTNIASAVICLATNQKFNFSKLIFDGMLRNLDNPKKKFLISQSKVGEGSGAPTEPQPTPSPTHPSTGDQSPVHTPHDSPLSGGHASIRAKGALNLQELFVLCTNLSNRVLALETVKDAQAVEILKLRTRIKKLERKCKPGVSHHIAWLKSVQRLSMKKRFGKKESVSKQGRKKAKPESTLDDSTFDDLDVDHGMDYMEIEDVVKEGRLSEETEEFKLTVDTEEIVEDKGSGEKRESTEELVSTVVPEIVSTARSDVDAARQEVIDVEPRTSPTTTSIFDDEDITMAQTLIKMKEEKAKEKGVSIKDIEDSSRLARSILTLKPLPTIDPKDKGKGVLEEPEPAKKMTRSDMDAAQIAKDAEVARLVYEKELAELEREKEKRQKEEEASKAAIAEMYDKVQAGIDADALFAAKLQQEERKEYTIEERAKFLAKTIVAQRRFRAAQRSAEIRSRPPTKSQLRNLMMTYLKNMGGYKHSQLKANTFIEIQGLYERQKRVIDDFKPMDSDDALHKEKVPKEPNSTKV